MLLSTHFVVGARYTLAKMGGNGDAVSAKFVATLSLNLHAMDSSLSGH